MNDDQTIQQPAQVVDLLSLLSQPAPVPYPCPKCGKADGWLAYAWAFAPARMVTKPDGRPKLQGLGDEDYPLDREITFIQCRTMVTVAGDTEKCSYRLDETTAPHMFGPEAEARAAEAWKTWEPF